MDVLLSPSRRTVKNKNVTRHQRRHARHVGTDKTFTLASGTGTGTRLGWSYKRASVYMTGDSEYDRDVNGAAGGEHRDAGDGEPSSHDGGSQDDGADTGDDDYIPAAPHGAVAGHFNLKLVPGPGVGVAARAGATPTSSPSVNGHGLGDKAGTAVVQLPTTTSLRQAPSPSQVQRTGGCGEPTTPAQGAGNGYGCVPDSESDAARVPAAFRDGGNAVTDIQVGATTGAGGLAGTLQAASVAAV